MNRDAWQMRKVHRQIKELAVEIDMLGRELDDQGSTLFDVNNGIETLRDDVLGLTDGLSTDFTNLEGTVLGLSDDLDSLERAVLRWASTASLSRS